MVKLKTENLKKNPFDEAEEQNREKSVFDPEGTGYDYESAEKYGIKPIKGHWQSRVPETGLLLKGTKHETWPELVAGEKEAGYTIYKGEDGRYYSGNVWDLAQEKPDYGMIALPKERLPGVWDYDRQLDQLLGDPKIDIEDLMPLDVRFDFGRIVGMTEKPDETKDRMANSLYYSILFNNLPRINFNLLDKLNEIAIGAKVPASTAWGRIKDRYRGGKKQVRAMDFGFDLLTRTWKNWDAYEQSVKTIEKLQSGIKDDVRKDFRSFFEKTFGAAAEQIPMLWETVKESPAGALAGGFIGAAIAITGGLTVPAPEEVITIPAATLKGAAIGAGVRGAIRIGQLEAGGMFLELAQMEDSLGNKIDPKIAAVACYSVGTINGAIEMAEWAVLLSTFGIGTKIFEKSAAKVTSKLFAEGTLKNIVAKNVLKYGAALTAETLQEIEQETSTVVFGEMAKELNNARKGTDFKPISAEDLKKRYREVTIESLRAFGVILAPGTAVSTAIDIATKKPEVVKPTAKAEEIEVKAPPTEAIPTPEKPAEAITKPEAVEVAPEAMTPEEFSLYEIPLVKDESKFPQITRIKQILDKADIPIEEIGVTGSHAMDVATPESDVDVYVKVSEANRDKADSLLAPLSKEKIDAMVNWRGIGKEGGILRGQKTYKRLIEKAKPPTVAKAITKEEVSPIVEPELTKQEEADISRLEAEIEEPFEMVRIKDVGFVIKEKATGKEVATVAKRKEAKLRLAEYNQGERKVRETRRKPKLLTEKATIGKLITEARALKAAMKKAAQAARKAYREGKAEGISKVKTYYYDIRQRERTRKQLKKRIVEAVKTITKDIPKSVDFNYREAIENLQAGIDPQFRMKKTLRMRERTREFLARKPEALKDMPVKLLKKLAQKPMNEYTIEEVEQIAEEIERLTKQGKLKRELRTKQKARKLEKITQEITETVSKGEKIDFESEPVTYETTKQGIIKTTFEKVKAWTWRPSRIFDMLDGMKDFAGIAHRTFIDQVNEAMNAKLRAVDKRKDAGMARMKELGITPRDLAQVRTIDDVRYMVDEMIGIYCASKNRLAKLALMYGNNLNEKAIDNVIANLTENEKAWGDFIISEYETRYDVLREKVIEVENRNMGYEENYIPIRRTEVDYSTHTEEILDAILQREHLRRTYAEHGFTIRRKEVPTEFQKPIRLNVTGVWASQINKQEQYIHLAELVRDLHKIAGDRDFRAAIIQQFGKEFNKVIKNYIDRVANPNIYKSYNSLENWSRKLRQHAVIAYLSYNLVTMGKQVPSVFLYLQDAGPTHLVSSAMEFVRHPLKMVDMVREKDPQVKHRAIERELEEMKLRNPEMYNNMLAKFGKAGMEGIYLFDAVARTIGWNAVYQKALKLDMSEAEAVQLAQNATLRTQPAAAAKDVAQLYATNEFANWFTMFTNQLNQIYNIATYDMRGYLKNRDYQKFALAATGMSITALTIWIIAHRRLPESKEDWVDVASEQAINAVPLVGKAIMAGKRGWGGTEIPAFELPKAAGRALVAVSEGKFDENDIKAIAEGIAVTSGIPYIGPKRVIKMADTGEIKELIGGEPIRKEKKPVRKRIKRSE